MRGIHKRNGGGIRKHRGMALLLLLMLLGTDLLVPGTVSRAAGLQEETGTIYLPPDVQDWYEKYAEYTSREYLLRGNCHFCSYAVTLQNDNVDLRDYLLSDADRDNAVISDEWPSSYADIQFGHASLPQNYHFSADGHSAKVKIQVPKWSNCHVAQKGDPLDPSDYLEQYKDVLMLENIPYGTSYTVSSTVVPDEDIISRQNDTGTIDDGNPEAYVKFTYPDTIAGASLDGGIPPYKLYKKLAVGKGADGDWIYETLDYTQVTFLIYDENPQYISGASSNMVHEIGDVVTDKQGNSWYEFAGCDLDGYPGYHWLVEVTAPDGYALMSEPFIFVTDTPGQIERHKDNEDAEFGSWALTVTNYRAAALTVTKTDALDNGQRLEGAQFALYQQNPAADDALPVNIQTTGTDGTAVFRGLAAGKTYYLKETAAPEGYEASKEILTVTVDADGTDMSLVIENTRIPDEPDEPDEPDDPAEPDKPDEPDKPEEPDKPDEPDKPAEPDHPAEPMIQIDTDEPAEQSLTENNTDTPVETTRVDGIQTGDDSLRMLLAGAGLSAAAVMAAVLLRRTAARRSYWRKR